MKHSFFKKFFVTTTAIILISLTAITIILSFFVSSFLTSDRLRILKKTCETVAEVTEVFDVNDINNYKNSKNFVKTVCKFFLSCFCHKGMDTKIPLQR